MTQLILYAFSYTDNVMHIRDKLFQLHYSSLNDQYLSKMYVNFLLILFFLGMTALSKEYESSFFTMLT